MSTLISRARIDASSFGKMVKRGALWSAGIATLLTLAIGILHTPIGRPLLAKLGIGCPITKATPEAIDQARAIPAAAYAGMPAAPARPVLTFEFERTTLSDVAAWAKKHGIDCEKLNGNETIRACKDVPAAALGEAPTLPVAEEVDFEFRASGTLAVLTVNRRGLAVEQSNSMVASASQRLRAVLGRPATQVGENTSEHFSKGPLQAYQEEYKFANYAATLTETRLGNTGVFVREHYFSPVQ